MSRLRTASITRSNALLMLIQGKAEGVRGLGLYSLCENGLNQWVVFHDH